MGPKGHTGGSVPIGLLGFLGSGLDLRQGTSCLPGATPAAKLPCMDTDGHAHLYAQRTQLEHELLAIERALESRMLAAVDAERLQLTTLQETYLAELGEVNAQLSALRDCVART